MSFRNVTIGVLPIACRVEGETFGGVLGMGSFFPFSSTAFMLPGAFSWGVVCGSTPRKSDGLCTTSRVLAKGCSAPRETLTIEHCSTSILLARHSPASVSQSAKIGKVGHVMSGAREKFQRREKRVNPCRHQSGAYQLDASQDHLLAPMQEGETFRPPSRYIGERQGVQVAASMSV